MLIFGLMKTNLNISLIQSSLFWEDIDANLSHFEQIISNISEKDDQHKFLDLSKFKGIEI